MLRKDANNTEWERLLEKGYSHSLKVITPQITYYKQKKDSLHDLIIKSNPMIKFKIINELNRYHVPLYEMKWGHIIYIIFMPKMFNLNLIIRKQSQISKLRDILQNN